MAPLSSSKFSTHVLCLLIAIQWCSAASVEAANVANDVGVGRMNGAPGFTSKLRKAESDVESVVSETNEKEADPQVVVRRAEFLSSVSEDVDLSSANLPVFFSISEGVDEVEDVTVVGSWSKWLEHFKLSKHENEFNGVIPIPPGKYHFKFILDGEWTTSNQWEVEKDKDGNLNNVITVTKELVQESEAKRAAAADKHQTRSVERKDMPTEVKGSQGKPLWKQVMKLVFLPFKGLFRILLTPLLILQGLLFGRD